MHIVDENWLPGVREQATMSFEKYAQLTHIHAPKMNNQKWSFALEIQLLIHSYIRIRPIPHCVISCTQSHCCNVNLLFYNGYYCIFNSFLFIHNGKTSLFYYSNSSTEQASQQESERAKRYKQMYSKYSFACIFCVYYGL